MKKRLALALALGAMAILVVGVLSACGTPSASTGGSSSSATVTEYDFYSAAIPDGYEESSTKNVFKETDGDGSFYVAVFNSSADDLLESELSSSDFEQGDDLTVGSTTYKLAKSDKWGTSYYITDWEDGSFEVKAQDVDDEDVIKAFLGSLKPAEDAYHKWQAAS